VTYREWPRKKVSVLGAHSIDRSKQKKKKKYVYMYSISTDFRDRTMSLYSSKIVHEREISRAVSNACIYCSNYKFGTNYVI
jgi:hypothetical protein